MRALARTSCGPPECDCASAKRQQRVIAPLTDGCRRRPAAAAACAWPAARRRARVRRGRGACDGPAPASVPGSTQKSSAAKLVFAVADILRHVEHHRARAAGGGDREGAADQFGDALVLSTRMSSLHRGAQDLDLPRFLRHVLPGMVAVGVADDRHQRDAGIERLRPAPVTRLVAPGPSVASHDAGAVGDPRPGIGGEGAAALVVDEVMLAGRAPRTAS